MYKKTWILLLLLCACRGNANAQCSATVCAGSNTTSACLLSLVSNLLAGTWTTSNSAVATVNSSGVITGVSGGTATITYHFIIFYTVNVTVNPQPTAAITTNGPVCSGQALAFDAHAGGAISYSWHGPNGFTSAVATPTITAVTPAATGTYSLTETTSLGCSASFTKSAVVGTPFTMAVSETAPLTITGEKIHTFCSGQTLTLAASATPSLPSSGISYTWSGPSTVVTTSSSFSPSLTAGSTTTVVPYTVAASYNGCTANAKDTVVVPASGASPCEYYTVNGYRSIAGLSPLSGCGDCNVIQPFHTVISSRLDANSVSDSGNYYIVNDATFAKISYTRDIFFMNTGVQLLADTQTPVSLSACHFFSSGSSWHGIRVAVSGTAAGHLSISNNTLIENTSGIVNGTYVGGVYVASTGNYYNTAGMADILKSDGVIYNRNFIGAAVYNYTPATSVVGSATPLPFTFTNSLFTNRELASASTGTTAAANYPFIWETASSLKTITTAGANPLYGISAYRSYLSGTAAHAGIVTENVGNYQMLSPGTSTTTATYTYNYMNIGSAVIDSSYAKTNLFDSLDFDIQLQNTNVILNNNTFSNARLTGLYVDNTINDVQMTGDAASHTNNRFYNNSYGIFLLGSWDFTCNAALFSAVDTTGAIPAVIGVYMVKNSGHHKYDISYNNIYNYTIGMHMQYLGIDPYSYLNGTTFFRNNHVTGKTTSTGTENTITGIELTDGRSYTGSNGDVYIDSNVLSGTSDGIYLFSYSQNIHLNYNSINLIPYTSAGSQSGIYCSPSPFINEIKNNTITGFGYDCSPQTYGISLHGIGDTSAIASISCNRVTDLNTGFNFELANHISWANNEMRRNKTGMQLSNSGTIGVQGSNCAPSDNHWEGDTCSTCSACSSSWPGWNGSGIAQTYVGEGVDASTSALYVRNVAHYMPTLNTSHPASSPYSLTAGTLINSSVTCSGMLSAISTCSDNSPASRRSNGSSSVVNAPASATDVDYTIYPNPGDGNMIITMTGGNNDAVKMNIINSVGAVVYTGQLAFAGSKANVSLSQLVPGVYITQLTSGNISVYKRIVILK